MARMMREHDWSTSPLGEPATWPQSLRSVVNLMLGSAFPMFVAWGPVLAQVYNDAYRDIMGDKHPAGLGRPLLENWAEIREEVGPLAHEALRGVSCYLENLPLRMRRGRGGAEDTWFTFSYSPVHDEEGGISGMFCACIETTGSVRAAQELRAREDWLQTLFDQAPGFAAVLRGPAHVFEMANEAYGLLTGGRDVVGKSVAQALPEVVGQGFVDLLDDVYRTGQPYVGRSVQVTVSHGLLAPPYEAFIDFMYQPLKNESGQIEGIFVQGHDVTEQHRAREALRQADRQKDVFIATLAHELRNPLAPIRTSVELLRRSGASESMRGRAADIIGRQVDQMARLLDDLLDIARITQRRLVLKTEPVALADLVESALEAVRPLADAKHQVLRSRIDSAVPIVIVDPVRITQVLSNLLNNAAKYTDDGGTIEIVVTGDARGIECQVSDTGIGMASGTLDHLFEMFTQEQSAIDRSAGGLGIGLALTKGLVELHGGSIEAYSEGLGRGSRFAVRLPCPAPAAAPAPQPSGEGTGQPGPEPAPPRMVLLADDNVDAVEVLGEWMALSGFGVHIAYDGVQAAEMAERLRPKVIVLDIGMPGLNGYQVAQRLRPQAWAQQCLMIAATGWGQVEDRQRAEEAGFDLHLTKPFDPQALVDLIGERAP